MRSIFFILLLVVNQAVAQTAWNVTSTTDAMTDKIKRQATTVNGDGHTLSVYRGLNDAAWVLFSLRQASFDQISPSRAPVFRVDKNPPHDLDGERKITDQKLGIQLYAWEPKWINFSIWHGKEAEGRSVQLRQLMSGQSVVFRYTLSTGGYKDTTFTLTGAGPAIADALGITPTPNQELEAAAQAYRSELVAATNRCQQDMPNFRTCFARVSACGKAAHQDLTTFKDCLK